MLALIAAVLASSAILVGLVGPRLARAMSATGETRLRGLKAGPVAAKKSPISLMRRSPSSIPVLKTLLAGGFGDRIQAHLERADIHLTSGEYIVLRSAFVAIPLFFFFVIFGPWPGLLVGGIFAAIGYFGPAIYLGMRISSRVEHISGQLAEFLRLTANALRAGFALLQAVEAASRDLDPPLSTELDRLLLDTRMGMNTEVALRAFADRTASYEVKAMITAILVQRTTGGNLAEVLDNVASSLEEREKIRGEVRAFTAQQRLTGNILSIYPLLLAGFFTLIHPSMMSVLWTDSVGLILLAIGATLQVSGFLVIRRIVNVEY